MSLYVDGSMNRYTGKYAWATITNEKGDDIVSCYQDLCSEFKLEEIETPKGNRTMIMVLFDDVKQQQNNGAELISMLVALRIAKQTDKIKYIYTDSDLILKWWSLGHISKKTLEQMSKEKIKYIQECTLLRKSFEQHGGMIIKVKGCDNIADPGYHV